MQSLNSLSFVNSQPDLITNITFSSVPLAKERKKVTVITKVSLFLVAFCWVLLIITHVVNSWPQVLTSLNKYCPVANISIPNFAFQRSHETYQKGQISVNKAKAKLKKKKVSYSHYFLVSISIPASLSLSGISNRHNSSHCNSIISDIMHLIVVVYKNRVLEAILQLS